jgi:amino acid adenylation domain-containing protein
MIRPVQNVIGNTPAPPGRGIDSTIQQAFQVFAETQPERIALACGDRRISYGELAAKSDWIADALRRYGVRLGDLVGLYMRRSPEAIASILGILKAGAAYVPFDASYPRKLLQQIYRDSAPVLMLIEDFQAAQVDGGRFWDGPAADLSFHWRDGAVPVPAFKRPPCAPTDLAYVMYTSGSSGQPKGVLVPHRAVLRLAVGNNFAQLDADQVLLQLAPLAFDASTFEIWGALLNGGTLAILPAERPSLDEIAQAIAEHGVTTLWLTAGLFHLMAEHRLDGLKPLRQLLAGGDVLSPAHVRKVLAALPQCRLINGYGPTENTTFSCCYSIPHHSLPDGPIPIGKAILHTELHILDDAQQPVRDGVEGELYVGGSGLADGYLNRPDLTAASFIANPFTPHSGARLYRTGDQVRRRPDGNLEFIGRRDRQVKISGKRVELDAVEACLRTSALVTDAAVVSFTGPDQQSRVAAFVTLAQQEPSALVELRAFLRQELAEHMLPSTLTVLAALPLGATGKVDRAQLPIPEANSAKAPAALPPEQQGDMQAILLHLWRQVLGSDTAGLDDNFFDLGGTSVQLIKVHALLQVTLGQVIPLIDLFDFPCISALAERLGHPSKRRRSSTLTAVERARLRNLQLDRSGTAQRMPS